MTEDIESTVLRIRKKSKRSWVNLENEIASREGRPAEFGTPKVEQSSRSVVERMLRETGLGLAALRRVVERLARQNKR